ncbi:hypothetical protein [Methylosinus sp. PW1]|uniref:hypothetical protein n=1 Tax=Methylosinus sp. PW1 TaxID=107636 RepID=UPI000A4F1494|nr:hypothetical protein [Methylosinus sp. PW1]
MIGIVDPSLRHGTQGRRPRPGDLEWAEALAAELARRAEALQQIAPRGGCSIG